MKTAIALLAAVAAAVCSPVSALACSEPFPTLQFSGSNPADGSDRAPVDAPIAIHALFAEGTPFINEETLEVFVTSPSGVAVLGTASLETFNSATSEALVVFQPDFRLEAGTRYEVRIPFHPDWSWEEGAYTFAFTTAAADDARPADQLGFARVDTAIGEQQEFGECLHQLESEDCDSCGDCGGCAEFELLSTERFFQAFAVLTRSGTDQTLLVRGGLGSTRSEAREVALRSTFSLLGLGTEHSVTTGAGFETLWTADAACAALQVTDLSGTEVWAEVMCIPTPSFQARSRDRRDDPPTDLEQVAPATPVANDPSPSETTGPDPASDDSSDGCQSAPGNGRSSPYGALALLALFARRARRQGRSVR